jgi:hypothetical protein
MSGGVGAGRAILPATRLDWNVIWETCARYRNRSAHTLDAAGQEHLFRSMTFSSGGKGAHRNAEIADVV